jgi:hypothetical protein
MRTHVFVRQITAGLLSHSRGRSAVSYPGEGNDVYQAPQDQEPPGRPADSTDHFRRMTYASSAISSAATSAIMMHAASA